MKLNAKWEHEIDRLIADLSKPTYVLRMARAMEHTKSGRTRALNARKEIREIVRKFNG